MGLFSVFAEALGFNNQVGRSTSSAGVTPAPTKQIGGEIGYFGLEQWWLKELSEADRRLIRARYGPIGTYSNNDPLTSGQIFTTSQSAASWLAGLAGWFKPAVAKEADLILRIADKAWRVNEPSSRARSADAIFARHLAWGALSKIYYRFREKPEYLDRSLEAANRQIAMQAQAANAWRQKQWNLARSTGKPPTSFDLPSHAGYKRMAIVLEKDNQFDQALALVREAKAAGWNGDWDKRIERLKRKLKSS